jgi:hypothetical protein
MSLRLFLVFSTWIYFSHAYRVSMGYTLYMVNRLPYKSCLDDPGIFVHALPHARCPRKGVRTMQMRNTPPVNLSILTDGWHPGFLLHISEEPTPPDWQMFAQSPTMYRWHFVLWENPDAIPAEAPEHQSGLTSTKFSPKGRYQASKAYTWAVQVLRRQIGPGEEVDWDTLYPVPCRVKVERTPGKDFIKVIDVEAWPEGQPFTVSLAEPLRRARAEAVDAPAPVIPPVQPPTPAAPGLPSAAAVQQGWGARPATTTQAPPAPAPAPPAAPAPAPQPATAGRTAW